MSDLDSARRTVDGGLDVLKAIPGVTQFGKALTFTDEEAKQMASIESLIDSYLNHPAPERPLSIAVFGPPGSGKSFGVKQLAKKLSSGSRIAQPCLELNLTQASSTLAIARRLREIVPPPTTPGAPMRPAPLVIFDEFDAPLDGAPLGWLSWLLAPMQDGKFWLDGLTIHLPRAIYVFAGGTASTMEDFARQDSPAFRAAKGPDFVSRLSAYMDVRGPNNEPRRLLRRGLAVRSALDTACEVTGRSGLALSPDLRDELLLVGRYRFGMRSAETVVQMIAGRTSAVILTRNDLPSQHLLDMHSDRGPLDPRIIGGMIGVSAGGSDTTSQNAAFSSLAQTVWGLGGSVSYGGHFEPGGLTATLRDTLNGLPERLRAPGSPDPFPRLELYRQQAPPDASFAGNKRVQIVTVPCVSSGPCKDAATLFRMRWLSASRCKARVLFGGKASDYSGRMPGILEEAVIALALQQPLYVLGCEPGAARAVGELLGLSLRPDTTTLGEKPAPPDDCWDLFHPAGFEHLPMSMDEATAFIIGHAIGGPNWVDNGLSVDENQSLFKQPIDQALPLLETGLKRVFGE